MGQARALWLLALGACHRGGSGGVDGGVAARGSPSPPGPPPVALALPLAAAHLRKGGVVVAGVSPREGGGIVVAGLGDDGAPRGTAVAVPDVAGDGNIELHVLPVADGAAIVYRGRRGDARVTQAVFVDAAGKPGAVFDAGSAACSTDDALAWIEQRSGAAAQILAAPWGSPSPRSLFALSPDRDTSVVCGDTTVFALGEGDEDTTVTASRPAPARARVVLRDRDFADEEREHDAFVAGGAFGLVRVGRSGTVAFREVGEGGASPWRRLTTRLGDSDDVVAVDGDARSTVAVYTREDTSPCDGASGASVHALRFSKAAAAERSFELAPAACDREVGPFWTGALQGGFVVAWVERSASRGPGEPGILGIAYRMIGGEEISDLRRVTRPADQIVDAGCDDRRCYAAALVRPAGVALGGPGAIDILAYP